jgi:hypothetical protein
MVIQRVVLNILPSVPPISVTVPESYPDTSPECDSKLPEYGM